MYGENPRSKPFWQGDLAISLRKVSNGYSIKINHSAIPDEIGQIIVADGKKKCFEILTDLFEKSDKAAKADPGTRSVYRPDIHVADDIA
jgi:hypothetical protein